MVSYNFEILFNLLKLDILWLKVKPEKKNLFTFLALEVAGNSNKDVKMFQQLATYLLFVENSNNYFEISVEKYQIF